MTVSNGSNAYTKYVTPVLSNAGDSSTITVTLSDGTEYYFTAVVESTSTYYTVGSASAQLLVSSSSNNVY
jgi:hypothetical protein